jgi:hypothetical protein
MKKYNIEFSEELFNKGTDLLNKFGKLKEKYKYYFYETKAIIQNDLILSQDEYDRWLFDCRGIYKTLNKDVELTKDLVNDYSTWVKEIKSYIENSGIILC